MRSLLLLAFAVCAMVSFNVNATKQEENDAKIEAVMADAKLKFKQGDNDVFMPDNNIEWRNGTPYCGVVSCYNEKDEPDHVAFLLEECDDWESSKHYYEVKLVKGKPVVVNQKGVTVKHEVAGRWDMLVFRNAGGAVLDVVLRKTDKYDEEDAADLRDMINGVYAGTGKNATDTVMFGAVYGVANSRLPGEDYKLEYMDYSDGTPKLVDRLHVAYFPERMKRVHMPVPSQKVDKNGVTHYYADDREISRDEYEHLRSMPTGYKGHGSLHGPLWWTVKPQGNDLAVELKEPFQEELDAFYSNFRDDKFTLKWVRSPYKGMKDRWAVLSMRPVTRGMLAYCDKATMQQMLKYLNARKTPTDIERLNKSLINTMVNGSK
ncbi:MAG: hypothetical protein IKW83_01070 [Muribaculaceae bacterium]|nr:hypothetical protein [Muribaculaceae bacterium]